MGETQAIHMEMPYGAREMSIQLPDVLGTPAVSPDMNEEGSLGFPAPEDATWITEDPGSAQIAD